MSNPTPPQLFPRFVLVGAGVVIVVTILIAAIVVNFIGLDTFPPTAPAAASRDLRFEDRPDGSVAVVDASDGKLVDVLAPGTNGFVRATLRGLARERKLEDVGQTTPFRLTGYADGRLTLEDPGTGRRVDLEAFGHTNLLAFARLLTLRSAAP
jgi:putative photosynthetic complex assembly protein